MTPVPRDLTIYKGTTFTFFVVLRGPLTFVNVVTADIPTSTFTTPAAHNLKVGDPVQFSTDGVLPNPVQLNVQYWVISIPSATTFIISADYAGAKLQLTVAGIGTYGVSTNWPIDLTGWSVWAYVKQEAGGTLVMDLFPAIDADPTTGKIDMSKTDEETDVMTPGAYVWDLILEDNGGQRIGPLFSGSCYIQQLVTDLPP
jgi:hypothetical protein